MHRYSADTALSKSLVNFFTRTAPTVKADLFIRDVCCKIRVILAAALQGGYQHLVLGALGCQFPLVPLL